MCLLAVFALVCQASQPSKHLSTFTDELICAGVPEELLRKWPKHLLQPRPSVGANALAACAEVCVASLQEESSSLYDMQM